MGIALLKVVRDERMKGSNEEDVMQPENDLECLGQEFDMNGEAMSGSKVLVVEDDPMLRRTLVTYLETKGFRPSCASSCAAALKTLRALPAEFAVMVADLDIEGEDTMALLRMALEKVNGPEVIYLANEVPEERGETLRALGAFETFEKPFVWDVLADAVNRAAVREEA